MIAGLAIIQRIGVGVQVNRLLNEFEQMLGMMKKMGGMKGGLPGMGGMPRF